MALNLYFFYIILTRIECARLLDVVVIFSSLLEEFWMCVWVFYFFEILFELAVRILKRRSFKIGCSKLPVISHPNEVHDRNKAGKVGCMFRVARRFDAVLQADVHQHLVEAVVPSARFEQFGQLFCRGTFGKRDKQ